MSVRRYNLLAQYGYALGAAVGRHTVLIEKGTVMDRILDLIMEYAPRIVGVFVLMIVAWIVAGWVGRLVTRLMQKAKIELTLSRFTGTLCRWLILIMALVAALGAFGASTTSFAAIIGAAALGIGLAFQGSLSNLAAGVMLLIFRPFKVGDYIATAGQSGKVQRIALFTTNMDTLDNRRIIIPNGAIFGSIIENLTHHEMRRVDVDVAVDYSADLDQTRQTLLSAAQTVPSALSEPAAAVVLKDLGDSAVNWQVRVWCKTSDYWAVRDAATHASKLALDGAHITIPFPQMDIHVEAPPKAMAAGG